MKKYRRVQADIDLDAVLFNFKQMKNRIPAQTKIMAVVKTDAYGHGAVPLAKLTEGLEYLWGFATATVDEAIELRKAGIEKPVLILGYSFPESYEQIVKYDICQTIFTLEMAEALSKEAVRQNKEARVHIKLDTGMGRIGYQSSECAVADVTKMKNLPMLKLEGVFTHFANADAKNQEDTLKQISKFDEMIRAMKRMSADVKEGNVQVSEINDSLFESYLDTHDIPDPDLMIRTSGEQRLSNYLLWQLAYSEFYFTDVPWPDFNKKELERAVEAYNKRDRRYGGLKEE